MIAKTYHVNPNGLIGGTSIFDNMTPEQVMYWFTQMLNKGSNVSALESAAWINKWMTQHGGPALSNIHGPSFTDIKNMIDRGRIGIGGFNVYGNLRLASGANPYKWSNPAAAGHVLIIIGYDDSKQSVIVNDPLRADPSGAAADYSWSSFGAAGFSDLSEVQGKALPPSVGFLDAIGGAAQFLSPDAGVANFFVFLDQVAVVQNPFTPSVPQDTFSLGPANVSFADPVSWASGFGQILWGDAQAIMFRLMLIALGLFMMWTVIRSWLPQSQASAGGGGNSAATAAQIAMLA